MFSVIYSKCCELFACLQSYSKCHRELNRKVIFLIASMLFYLFWWTCAKWTGNKLHFVIRKYECELPHWIRIHSNWFGILVILYTVTSGTRGMPSVRYLPIFLSSSVDCWRILLWMFLYAHAHPLEYTYRATQYTKFLF